MNTTKKPITARGKITHACHTLLLRIVLLIVFSNKSLMLTPNLLKLTLFKTYLDFSKNHKIYFLRIADKLCQTVLYVRIMEAKSFNP